MSVAWLLQALKVLVVVLVVVFPSQRKCFCWYGNHIRNVYLPQWRILRDQTCDGSVSLLEPKWLYRKTVNVWPGTSRRCWKVRK